jgi:hypothetical protein
VSIGEDIGGACGALRKGAGTLFTGRTWYAWGSCRKLKSLWGMSSMPRDGASWDGCGEARGRAGDRMRAGRLGVLSARGLHHFVSVFLVVVFHAG